MAPSSPSSLVLRRLGELFPDSVLSQHERLGDATVAIAPARLLDVMLALRDDAALHFEMLMDLTAVDHLGRQPRFDVVYHLYSLQHGHRVRVVVGLGEDECEVDSLVSVWPAANWAEREVWDLYGITFRRHPDLRRILLYEEFEGHPLRKDYPKTRRQPLHGVEDP